MTSLPTMTNSSSHVLVASPSPLVQQRLLESLRRSARRVEQATGGAAALVLLERGSWHVLTRCVGPGLKAALDKKRCAS